MVNEHDKGRLVITPALSGGFAIGRFQSRPLGRPNCLARVIRQTHSGFRQEG